MASSLKPFNWGFSTAITSIAATISQATPYIAEKMVDTAQQAPMATPATTTSFVVDERLMEAKLEAAEARTETKFAQLLGRIDTLAVTLNNVSEKLAELRSDVTSIDGKVGSARTTYITTAIASVIAIASLSYAAVSIFQGGMGATSSAFSAGMDAGAAKRANPS